MFQRKRHYWRLDSKCITLFQNDTGSRYYKVRLASLSVVHVPPCILLGVKGIMDVVHIQLCDHSRAPSEEELLLCATEFLQASGCNHLILL